MAHWMWPISLIGILSTAVVFGTDVFFLMIGKAALKQASVEAGTEVMGFFHLIADARMPVWGVLAIVSNLLLAIATGGVHRWFYLTSVLLLILFVLLYTRFSKRINRIQIDAAQSGKRLSDGRELQTKWDRLLLIRVPLLAVSLLAQSLVLLVASA